MNQKNCWYIFCVIKNVNLMVENIIPNKNGILINVTEFKKPTTHCLCRDYAWNLIHASVSVINIVTLMIIPNLQNIYNLTCWEEYYIGRIVLSVSFYKISTSWLVERSNILAELYSQFHYCALLHKVQHSTSVAGKSRNILL